MISEVLFYIATFLFGMTMGGYLEQAIQKYKQKSK